jgi:hypothetical protein
MTASHAASEGLSGAGWTAASSRATSARAFSGDGTLSPAQVLD